MCTVADTKIEIDDEFEALLPAHSEAESKALREAVERDGYFTDELLYWREGGKNLLIDGHQRYDLYKSFPVNGIIPPPHVKEVKLPDRHAVRLWMLRRQLGRRNLTENDYWIFEGRLYNETKQDHGGDRKSGSKCQSDNLISAAEIVAKETGSSPRKVTRSGAAVEALDAIGAVNPKAKADIETKALKVSKDAIVKIAKSGDIPKALTNLRNGKAWDDGTEKPAKPKATKPTSLSPAKHADSLTKTLVSPLVKGIDKLAEINGGKGPHHKAASAALDILIAEIREMRGGAK